MDIPIRLFADTILCIFILLAGPSCAGQEVSDDLSRSISDLKQRIEKDETVTEAIKTEITTLVQTAESNLAKTEELNKRIASDELSTSSAASRSSEFLQQLEKLKAAAPKVPSATMLLTDIETAVISEKQAVEVRKQELIQNEQESTRRLTRRQELPSLIDNAQKQIAETQLQLNELAVDDSSFPTQARRIVLQSGQRLLETERKALLTEQNRYEVGDKEKVLRNQRDLLTIQLSQAQARLAEMERLQTEKRQEKAKQAAEAAATAQSDIEKKNPLLVSSYEKNTTLAKRVQELELDASQAKTDLNTVTDQAGKLGKQFRDIDKRIRNIGLTGSVGAMLRKRKSDLPSVHRSLAHANKIKTKIDELQYEMFDIEQQLDELSPSFIQTEIADANGPQDATKLATLETPIAELIVARKEQLDAVDSSLDRLFEQLFVIESKERELARETTKFRDYINERILWIRSNDHLFASDEIDDTDKAIFNPSTWSDALKLVWQAIITSPVISGFAALLILLLLVFKPKLRFEVDRLGQLASRGSCDSFWPTAHVFVLTVLIAITVPLIPLMLGLLITWSNATDNVLFNALGAALIAVAWFAMPFEILRRICRPKGLANEHFDWTHSSVAILRKNVGRIAIPGALLVFFIALFQNLDQTHRVDLIERVLFIVGTLGLVYFLWQTFHPTFGIFDDLLRANERSWANQTSWLWFSLILLVPLSLAVLVILGFYYTAINLAECAFGTFVFAIIVETIRELLKRLILVQRRHVHIQAARKKRDAQLLARKELQRTQAEAESAGLPTTKSETPDPAVASTIGTESILDLQHELDIDDNAKQAYKLVSLSMVLVWAVGLWMIWSDVLPALRALDNYPLWPTSIVQNGFETPPAETTLPTLGAASAMPIATGASQPPVSTSSPTVSAISPPNQVTVRNLLVFLVISIITIISTRNLPSALEMLLLEHLPVDRSFRYAIKSLVSYAIVMVGTILAFRALSISWSSVQWLATALTFGLAFGLQEIFANFVAGIILMFERPMRIGDWITVDDFTGVVTKIRTRATTIVNWDRKEYVIPNKDFITGRLVNWTLSDTLNRIVINVGVAYGSDIEKTKRILLEVCQNHPKTVDDPPTRVTFEAFGDSSLNFVVRTFLNEVDSRLMVIDDLHTQIDAEFRKSNIVIAFPQRDLHFFNVDEKATASIREASRTTIDNDLVERSDTD